MILPFSNFGLDHAGIVAAIEAMERETSGAIRVVVARADVPDPVAEAQRQFQRLGLSQLVERNAVLILLAPRSRTFAVIGDAGIHARCGDLFWDELSLAMARFFSAGDLNGGLVCGIEQVGAALTENFPAARR